MTKKQALLKTSLEKLESSMTLPGYAEKVPQEVQEANLAKQNDLTAELERIAESIKCLTLMD